MRDASFGGGTRITDGVPLSTCRRNMDHGIGLPFPHPMGEEAVCADCARQKPSWDRARAVMRYDKHSRQLVLALKHGDRTNVARARGRWMGRAGAELLDGA